MRISLSLFFFAYSLNSQYRLLIKFPTRGRPMQFFQQLDNYYSKLSGKNFVSFLVSCDANDPKMNNTEAIKKLQSYKNLYFYFGQSKTKMEAINADVEKHLDFDILLLASDDMTPIEQGYDQIIAEKMKTHFSDLDGVLHFNDGRVGDTLNTICILGKKYYNRFNYIYYPGYLSVACDVDFMLTSEMLGKAKYFDQMIIRHDHASLGYFEKDELYYRNEDAKLLVHDKKILQTRKAQNFELKYEEIAEDQKITTSLDLFGSKKDQPVKWSILIPTLDSRKNMLVELYRKLLYQIEKHQLYHKIEVLIFKDNKHNSVGYKRNKLIEAARGEFISFVDDDDDVHDNYIKMIFDKLLKNPDCVSLTGIITFSGKNPQKFIHSIRYNSWFERAGVYYRPPNHLNPIKKSKLKSVRFPDKNNGEDADWSMQICKLKLLKNEEKILEPYYFYRYDPKNTETQAS